MAEIQEDFANLNRLIDEIMRESVEAVEEVQTETQPEDETSRRRMSNPIKKKQKKNKTSFQKKLKNCGTR